MKRLLFILLALAGSALAQNGNTVTISANGAPAGTCGRFMYYVNASNGDFYDCPNGSWNIVTGGGGGGVTSVSGDGALITNSASTGVVTLTIGSAAAHKFWGNNTGSPATATFQQLACADLSNSGTACTAVTPANTAAATHQFFTAYTAATGVFTQAQPACGDLSDAGTACTTVAPANTAASSHQFFTAYTAASGAFTQAQPAFSDISSTLAASQAQVVTFWQLGGAGGVASAGATALNANRVWAYTLPVAITGSTKFSYDVQTADNSADTYDIGIYNSSGTLLCHTGSTAGTTLFPSTGVKIKAWTATCDVPAGEIYLAITAGTAGTAILGGLGSSPTATCLAATATNNVTSGGVLNSSVTFSANALVSCTLPNIAVSTL